uniref:Uncharacterized protein n=1 Tax=Musca domestica TaxID=7370 RepID=A0A1I8M4L9_MUSDO
MTSQESLQFSLSELSRAALGGNSITSEHLHILQNLFMILLKKLNCENETVRITGFDGPCCRTILENSNDNKNPFKLRIQNVEIYQKYYDLLEQLEMQTKSMQDKLEQHFSEIRKRCATNEYSSRCWDFYASPTEDLCTLYSDYNKEFCTMAQHPTFNVEIRRRMTRPVLQRISNIDSRLEVMRDKLRKINDVADRAEPKLKLVEALIGDIESKRHEVQQQWHSTREAMQEVQEMLNCKLDRMILPTMKKDLEKRFAAVDQHIAMLRQLPNNCSAPAQAIDVKKENICISCSPYSDRKLKPKLNLKFPNEKKCKCARDHTEPTLLEKMDKIQVKTYKLIAVPVTSSLLSYDETTAHTITQELHDAGHYVHRYTSYNKYRFQDSFDLDPLITVATNNRFKTMRRLREHHNN